MLVIGRFAYLLGVSAVMVLAGTVHAPVARAAGFAISDRSASTLGNAMAGAGAVAYDASTIYFNPAAMQLLEHSQLSIAAHLIRPRGTFRNQGSNTSGQETADSGTTALSPSLYYVHVQQKIFAWGWASMCHSDCVCPTRPTGRGATIRSIPT